MNSLLRLLLLSTATNGLVPVLGALVEVGGRLVSDLGSRVDDEGL